MRTLKILLICIYQLLGSFCLAAMRPVQVGDRYGMINEDGVLKVPAVYRYIGPYKCGLAAVGGRLADVPSELRRDHQLSNKKAENKADDLLMGYLDPSGNLRIPLQWEYCEEFSHGLARVKEGESWGVIDTNGAIVLQPVYHNVIIDGGTQIPVQVIKALPNNSNGNLKWSLARIADELSLEGAYDYVFCISDGMRVACLSGKYGVIDANGKTAIAFQYSSLGQFGNGLAPASSDGVKYGYVDKKGSFACPQKYYQAEPFVGGIAIVKPDDSSRRVGLINTNFEYVLAPDYDNIRHLPSKEWLAESRTNHTFSILAANGELIFTKSAESLEYVGQQRFWAVIQGKHILLDDQGREIADLERWRYDKHNGLFRDGLITVLNANDKKRCFINRDGQDAFGVSYDYALPFSDGIASVHEGGIWRDTAGAGVWPLIGGGRWKCINNQGKVIWTSPQESGIHGLDDEGFKVLATSAALKELWADGKALDYKWDEWKAVNGSGHFGSPTDK
jgi:hypothetical protein